MTWTPRRRFWQSALVRPEAGGFTVLLDARPLRTPSKAPVNVPTRALAAAIAAEWSALEDEIRPDRLPFTRAANSAIDRVAPQREAVIDAVAAFGEADLVCYRAAEPRRLRDRQAAAWDPWLTWAARDLDAPLVAVTGVMHHPQPPASLAKLRAAVAAHGPFALTALHELVTLSGSLVLGLAVARGALDAPAAWALSRVDEDWQAEQWGIDHEAATAETAKRADFLRAESLLALLAGDGSAA